MESLYEFDKLETFWKLHPWWIDCCLNGFNDFDVAWERRVPRGDFCQCVIKIGLAVFEIAFEFKNDTDGSISDTAS